MLGSACRNCLWAQETRSGLFRVASEKISMDSALRGKIRASTRMNQLLCDVTAVEFFVWPVIVYPGRVVHYLSDGELTMKLFVPKDHLSTMDGLTVDITDEDINDAVGSIRFEKGVGRHIELYGRYRGTVLTHAECVAFVKGVETVLNYIRD
jgi:hypothetical protein